ncbi:MAG TPA: hypothetical protein VN540_03665 [Clostridia bacterium]|nr:hypothetical protein [Clostridia bacterium]
MTYAVLYHPGHNRVYFEAALRLAPAEFRVAAERLGLAYADLQNREICGVNYLTFKTEETLSAPDIRLLSDLSFAYALFLLEGEGDEPLLKPIARTNERFVDDGIGAMLKYTGKTNEIFTRMMINFAYCAQPCEGDLCLLDPVAGKGTTLFEGLRKGYDVYGIEIGEKVTAEAVRFLQRFLENAKYKFEYKTIRLSGPGKSFAAVRHAFEIARTKQEQKEKHVRTAAFVAGDARHAGSYFKKNTFHMIVGDLPYGVQHASVTEEKQSPITRSPAELLGACLPAWVEVLRPGGSMVLSWNSNVLSRERMVALFEQNGLNVRNENAYSQFAHRVDQSIVRDIVVANKK